MKHIIFYLKLHNNYVIHIDSLILLFNSMLFIFNYAVQAQLTLFGNNKRSQTSSSKYYSYIFHPMSGGHFFISNTTTMLFKALGN